MRPDPARPDPARPDPARPDAAEAGPEGDEEPSSPRSLKQTVGRLWHYLWPQGRRDLRIRVVVAVLSLAGAKLATVIMPILYGRTVDALSPAQGATETAVALPLGVILAYALSRFGMQGFAQLRDFVFARVAQSAVRQSAVDTFRHLHALSLRFHLERRTGGLNRVIERGTKGMEFVLTFMLFNIVPTLLEILLVVVILAELFDIWFALITLGSVAGFVGFTLLATEWRLKFRRSMNDRDAEANTKAVDSLLNYETVKYFANEKLEIDRFEGAMRAYARAAVASRGSLAALNAGQAAIIAAGLGGVMLLAALGVMRGNLTIGEFVTANTYLMQLFMPLNFLGFAYREIKQGLVDMERMFDLVDTPPEVRDAPDAAPLEVGAAAIRFRDVVFSYDPRREILHGISFDVPPGQRIAIVGPSGAGKSTITRILYRFYDISGGSVEIDGQDIRQVTQDSLRRAIGIVPQDTVLFNDSIRYNIRYGRPASSDAEVEAAARAARIHDFVAGLPDGYDTLVGERGLKLSGGEKQRVAIARAVLKDPPVLIFDEATSALDSETEKQIQASLETVAARRTTLVIAHRLSTVVDADEILVLVGGRIVERGSHAALLERGGAYAGLWTRQQSDPDADAMEDGRPDPPAGRPAAT
ncbi:MAG: ABC transporter ATP-binding protein/permease [Sneathiellaceae bacterium]